jgi:transcriptional regulator with GAF, ATPase, and Fis domain
MKKRESGFGHRVSGRTLLPDARRRGSGNSGPLMNAENKYGNTANLKERVDAYERALVLEALKTARGNQSHAAKILGTSQRIVNYKIRKYSIDTGQFR